MSSANLGWFIAFWIAFTCVNFKINVIDVEAIVTARYEKKQNESDTNIIRQNEPHYISVLTKIKGEKCSITTDYENNIFYSCSDGSKISMIRWTRGERKGVVTREYNSDGKLISIYGHPDDVY